MTYAGHNVSFQFKKQILEILNPYNYQSTQLFIVNYVVLTDNYIC